MSLKFYTMGLNIFIEKAEKPFCDQSNNVCAKILGYSDKLELDTAVVDAFIQGNSFLQFVHDKSNESLLYSKSLTKFKETVFHGNGAQDLGNMPVLNPLPVKLPGIPMKNMQGALLNIAKSCKGNSNFNDTIGLDLGILKEVSPAKPEDGTPNLTVKLASGGHPILHATKGEYQGYQVWRDSNDGKGFILANVSLYADYLDLFTIPVAITGTVWNYKAIYIAKGEVVGKWSPIVSILVFNNSTTK